MIAIVEPHRCSVRASMTRFAFPIERSTVPGSQTTTKAETPTYDLI